MNRSFHKSQTLRFYDCSAVEVKSKVSIRGPPWLCALVPLANEWGTPRRETGVVWEATGVDNFGAWALHASAQGSLGCALGPRRSSLRSVRTQSPAVEGHGTVSAGSEPAPRELLFCSTN